MDTRYAVLDLETDRTVESDLPWDDAVACVNHLNADGHYRYAVVRDHISTDYHQQGG